MTAHLYGIGVGPGDPELLTVKAIKAIEASDVLCYVANPHGESMAFDIARPYIGDQQHMPIVMQISKDRTSALQAYALAAKDIGEFLTQGRQVGVLCEGDPLFYGSFIYLFETLADQFKIEVIPGVNAISAAAARSLHPLCRQSQTQAVVNGRNSNAQILAALAEFDSVAILKVGAERDRLVALIEQSGRAKEAVYVEKATHDDEIIYQDIKRIPATAGAYFSLFLVSQVKGRR